MILTFRRQGMGSNEIIKLYALVILFDQSIFNIHIHPYVPKLIMRITEDNSNTPHAGNLLATCAYHLRNSCGLLGTYMQETGKQ